MTMIFALLAVAPASAQADKADVRKGNRDFRKGNFREAEIDYRKAVLKDSLSLKAQYNLASALYREEEWDAASKALQAVAEAGAQNSDYHFNAGDVALQAKDYAAAVESFKQSLLLNPGDLEAKENYIYAKKMLENRQQNGGGGQNDQDQDQDQNQNQDQDQNQDENQDQNQDQNQDSGNKDNQQDQGNGQDNGQSNQQQSQASGQDRQSLSKQQAAQMLRAIQAKENETQEKVNKEKALMMQSSQKEKNW